jgi:purine nucleosidase
MLGNQHAGGRVEFHVERLILDVDLAMGAPGSDIDDGFALALALAEPDIALELVTTVNGNTDVDTATTLTLELLDRLGHPDVPLHRGAARPLLRPQDRTGSVPDGVPVRDPRPGPAAVAMVEHVLANPGQITLVAVGPLTNVALAMRLHRDFASSLKALVIMGGVYNSGTNRTDMPGEFNVWSDPEAAQVVLTSGIRARWVGLDVTLQVQVTKAQALQMQDSDRPFASFAGRYTAAWIDHLDADRSRPEESCAMHDPLAVAAVTHPELLTFREAHVQVELGDRLRGAMLADYLESGSGLSANAEVAVAVDADGFNRLLLGRIAEL